MKISDLFNPKNGLSSSSVCISEYKTSDFNIPYIRPSSSYHNLVAGFVNKNEINAKYVFPSESIFVSTDGQGSHSYAYVSPVEFVPNSNVCVLIPKIKMDLRVKIFYAMVITKNRYRFSYGRKPKGDRFTSIDIPEPDKIPKWALRFKIDKSNYNSPVEIKKYNLKSKQWKWFKYDELFVIKKGKRLTKANMIPGKTPFIGSIDSNNGYREYIGQPPNHKGNTITINYNGSVGEAFYQPEPFFACDDVNVLYPKFELNKYSAFFITTLIRKEKYRFNYGRKWETDRMKDSLIKLPIDKSAIPDFKFMEDYIKSLPYSKSL